MKLFFPPSSEPHVRCDICVKYHVSYIPLAGCSYHALWAHRSILQPFMKAEMDVSYLSLPLGSIFGAFIKEQGQEK